jgi:plastocyanin
MVHAGGYRPLSTLGVVVALVLASSAMAAAHSQSPAHTLTGRVSGTVRLGPSVARRKSRLHLYTGYGPGASGEFAADTNELLNVVIYIELAAGMDAGVAPPVTPRPMLQRNEAFVPHTLPVLRGSTVQFRNEDPFFHNVFSLSHTRTFDLGRYAEGNSKSITFPNAGIVQVFCHIHAGMSGIVLVLENSLFAVPDSVGRFEIGDIPPGTHRIVAWHERTGPVSRTLIVRQGETTLIDFRLPDAVASVAK